MLNDKKIRLATEDDSDSLLEIYAPYITNTTYTFEYDIPTIMEFKPGFRRVTFEKMATDKGKVPPHGEFISW